MRAVRLLFIVLMSVLALNYSLMLLLPAAQSPNFAIGQVDNIAHQGGNLEMPDATLLAFDAAVASGANVLEMDVHLSLDGHLVVIHDDRVDRTSNGQGAVRDMTLQQISTFDAAYWWPYHSNDDLAKTQVPPDMTFPYRNQGYGIPTLVDVLERYPQQRLTIELKDNSPQLRHALSRTLNQYQRWDSTLVASFYQETLKQLRQEQPQAQTYAAENEIRLLYALHLLHLEKLFPYLVSVDALAVPMTSGGINLASARFIEAAHNAGLLVHYWTINDKEHMQQLLLLGADGIMTDRPSLLSAVKAELLQLSH